MNQLSSRRKRRGGISVLQWFVISFCIAIIVFLIVLINVDSSDTKHPTSTQSVFASPTGASTPEPTMEPTRPPLPDFLPRSAESTRLENFDFTYQVQLDGNIVTDYMSADKIDFGVGSDYTQLEGVISFRGNNFRQNAAYGIANVVDKKLSKLWNVPTYSLPKGESSNYQGSWTGSGWTGQPLLVKWPHSTKQIMNMFDWAKADDDLTEVIYATMDGNIYFLDLETGKPTRNKMVIGVPFKGAGSLDPRGYPLLYLGSGEHYNTDGKRARAMIVSLIDCKIIYEFGVKPDSFALREWTAYDSSALVCAEADTLIYPGENGTLYILKLNTKYDEKTGTISVSPNNLVKMRYESRKSKNDGFWLGYEGSAAAFKNYLFLTENSGMMQCVDLNTMKVIWVQDIWDDTNASPAFEIGDDGNCYLYVGNTLDSTADDSGHGNVALFKLNATTGEIVWKKERGVYTTKGVTGGIMSSVVLGENKLKGLVFLLYASYGNGNIGSMVALDTVNGDIVWEKQLSAYSWCSPSAVYDKSGNGYIIQCNYSGNVYLIDGLNGDILDTFNIESNIEASPAVFNDTIIIGTRVKGIWAIKIQ